MVRGLYIAGTNMLTSTKKMDLIGNNIANMDVVGYKKDDITVESFNDVLISKRYGSNINMEKKHGDIEVNETSKGYYLSTDDGFFRVNTDTGISNNKSVKIAVDQDGYLSTYYLNSDKSNNYNLGNRVIDNQGKEIFVGQEDYIIEKSGQILVNGESIGNLVKDVNQNVIGTINSGVKDIRVITDHSQGQLKMTGKSLDVAIKGSGYFQIQSGDSTFYTRNGVFNLTKDNELVTIDGYNVQGIDGNIKLPSTDISINEFGEIIYNDEIIDKLKITDFSNKGDLEKVGASFYMLSSKFTGEEIPFSGSTLQGYIEDSNINSIEEMVKMTKVSKSYESSQKVISAIDKTLDKAINEVGIVRG